MGKRIVGREKAVEALAALCNDYRGTALRAIREGGETVYIPVTPGQEMVEALRNPDGLMEFASQNENQGGEPVYASREEFVAGRNADGSVHAGYAEVDVVAKLITDVCARDGESIVPKVRPLGVETLLIELTGKKDSYCLG